MQRRLLLLPTGRKRVKLSTLRCRQSRLDLWIALQKNERMQNRRRTCSRARLRSVVLVILSFSVGYQMQEKHGDGADEDNVNVAAFMLPTLKNTPKNQQANANPTHL